MGSIHFAKVHPVYCFAKSFPPWLDPKPSCTGGTRRLIRAISALCAANRLVNFSTDGSSHERAVNCQTGNLPASSKRFGNSGRRTGLGRGKNTGALPLLSPFQPIRMTVFPVDADRPPRFPFKQTSNRELPSRTSLWQFRLSSVPYIRGGV